MITLTPSLLVAAANAFVGLGEVAGDNRGQLVEMFLREVRQSPGQPWCAAFVHHVGYWSHFDHRAGKSRWPLPANASCEELEKYALVRGVRRKQPFEGDVFLLFSKELNRIAHAGIVVTVNHRLKTAGSDREDNLFVCTTVEGNANDDGSREGRITLRKARRFSVDNGDRFIHWPDLDFRAQAA
jgi:hypothetical protein